MTGRPLNFSPVFCAKRELRNSQLPLFLLYSPGIWDGQWLLAKRLVTELKKSKTNTKLVREITIAAKMGDADPANNARLFAAVEKAKKESVPKDAIQRAINKGAGIGGEKAVMEHVVYEGRAPTTCR